MSKRRKSRELALQALYQIDIGGLKIEEVLKYHWTDRKYHKDITDYATDLIYGTMLHKDTIDQFIIDNLTNYTFEELSEIEKNILRFSIYSMLYLKNVPFKVIVDEAIEISKKYGIEESYKLINGVLECINSKIKNST